MKSMMRVGFIVLSAAAGLTACNCNPTTTQCSDVQVSFTSPSEGATVNSPFQVKIAARGADGAAVDFDTATLKVGTQSFEGTVSGSSATFDVTAAAGSQTLEASVTKGACGPTADGANKIASVSRTVTVAGACSAKVSAVSFPQDANADGTLNGSELPMGTDLQVRVTASCASATQVRIKRGTGTDIVGAITDISSGVATVAVPVGNDGTFDLFAELVNSSGTAVNTTVTNPEGLASITVQRTAPSCTNTTKLVNGPNDDADGNTTGFQLTASGTVGSSTVSTTFRVTGQNSKTATPALGNVSAQFTLPTSGDVTYTVDLVCTDVVGNSATDTKMVRVDFQGPAIVITAPTIPDGGPAVVTATPLTVTGTTDADAVLACGAKTFNGVRTQTGCATVTNGAFTLSVPFSSDGLKLVDVEVTDAAGNSSMTAFEAIVTLAGCGLEFSRPSQCPALITQAQVSNGNYAFQSTSKPSCVGQPMDLFVRTVLSDGGMTDPSPVGSTMIGSTGTATVPASVSSGSYVYSASVTNPGADAGMVSVDCDVTVDLDGPSIVSPAIGGQPFVVLNANQDTQPGTPGAQRLLQFSARIPVGGHVDLCTTQAVDPVSSTSRPQTPECGTGYYLLQTAVTSPTSAFTYPEGTYSIKIVVVGGGTTVESTSLPLFVDVTRPCLLASSRVLPQDANHDSNLNATELGVNAPTLAFSLDPACQDTDASTLSPTTAIVVREIVNGSPTGSFTTSADVSSTNASFTVRLTQNLANEKNYTFFVQLTDSAGNSSSYSGVSDVALFPVRIDKVAPSCDVVSPSSSQTLLGAAQVPGGQFGSTVATSADVGAGGVSATLSGFGAPQTFMLTPAGPANQASTTFTVAGTHDWVVAATCTDSAGNATAATSRNLTIDLDAPTCAITSPTATTYSVNDIPTNVSVGGAEGRSVTCTTNGTPLTPPLVVSGGTASQSLSYPNGTQTVACSVSDLAGNSCTTSVSGVIVNSTACSLSLTNAVTNSNGTWFNRSNTSSIVGASGIATVVANSSDCGPMKSVTLQRTSPSGSAVVLPTDVAGDVSFSNVALTDGENWAVTIDNGTGITTTRTFRVALIAPAASAVAINATAVSSGAALTFVAAVDNHNVETATPGYFADQNAASAGAQLDLQVTSVSGAQKFGLDGTIQVLFKGAVVASQAVNANPQTFSFAALTLPHNDVGLFEVRVTDPAGNMASVLSNTTTIDVIAPAPPAITQTLTNSRAATVSLQWSPTYDDGTDSASGGHSGYDVRWTTSSVPGNAAMASSANYFANTSAVESTSDWSASTIVRQLTLPPLNTYYIGVRARDEVGNYSAFAGATPLANQWTLTTLSNPSVSTDFGSTIAAYRSVVGDGLADLVVASATRGSVGSVYVYAGSSSFASQAGCATGCQELTPIDGVGALFGSDVSTDGNLGDDLADATTTGVADVVVGQRSFTTTGRAFIFFGTTGSTLATTVDKIVEIRGDATNTQIGWATRIIRDVDGDGLDELALTAYLYGGGRGRIYIFKGRDLASWHAKRVSGQNYLSVTSADWIVEADALIPASPTNTSNGLGLNRLGFASLPGVTGGTRADGGVVPEIVVPLSRANVSRLVMFSGSTIANATNAGVPVPLTISDAGVSDAGIQTLSQPGYASNSVFLGFGASTWGRQRVMGSGAADLFVGYPIQATVFYYSNWGATGAPGGTATGTLGGPATFGANLNAGDINGDGRVDLLVSEGATVANGAWLLYQKASMGPFDTPVGPSSVRFQVSEFRVASGTSKFGANSGVADIDGVNGPDVILSDETSGVIRIWR